MNGLNRLKRAARTFAVRFARGTRGNVAMMFGLALPVLVMIGFGAVDIHQASKVKANLQDALDAAALAAARSKYTDDVNLNRVGLAALKANMPTYFKDGSQDTASFTLNDNRITANARVNVKVLVANIVLPPYGKLMDDYLPVGSSSEVLRASRNVEVAMALDITGSMKDHMGDLKTAAKDLIDLVVQKEQSPFYSRVALVPYSMGVNVGSYADKVRGPLQGATAVTGAGWADAAKAVSSISRGSPAVVTASAHGLETGDRVWLSGVSLMTNLNDRIYTVTVLSPTQFRLNGTNTSSGYSRDGTGGTVRKCWRTDCTVVVTSVDHKLSDGDGVRISGVQGMTGLNGTFQATRVTADTFRVDLLGPNQAAYSRNGSAQCGYDGCAERIFINRSGVLTRIAPGSSGLTCVSERAGGQAYTDAAPAAGQWIGRNYADSGNPCLGSQITPLSSQIASLKSTIDGYTHAGSTAGQIGIAWGWYMVSPHFGSLWPSTENRPADYDASRTLKAVILMTDGEFNTPYCEGVISKDAPSNGNAGRKDYHIGCSATNGSPFAQSVAMCEAMRRENIVVYTVGFNLGTDRGKAGVDTAIEVMETCATSKDKHFFKADSGTDLKDAFKAIGRDITRLRIAR